jgi:DNA (cytosine-5)-methyltransferase 1
VLAHHWPHVRNYGDMTRFAEWDCLADADILAGGTPCQAFSVAGLRKSLDDARGNLTLTYVRMLDEIDRQRNLLGRSPAVCVWENVPGVLSTKDNAFGCFLGGLAGSGGELQPPDGSGRWANVGYVRGPRRSVAWRVLDAQYFGVAQRRRRVFLVGCADAGFRPEQVLLKCEGLRRDTPPRREAGKGHTGGFEAGPGGVRGTDLAPTLDTRCKDGPIRNQVGAGVFTPDVANCLQTTCDDYSRADGFNMVAQHMIGGFDYEINAHGPDDATGTLLKGSPSGGGRPLPAVCFEPRMVRTTGGQPQEELSHCLRADANGGDGAPCVAFMGGQGAKAGSIAASEHLSPTLRSSDSGSNRTPSVMFQTAVRRLTPEECETLQGFEPGHTRIPWRGKPAADCPDGNRYKAIGNSMAVPCMAFIGGRIAAHLRTRKQQEATR